MSYNNYEAFTYHASQTEIRKLKVLKERQVRLNTEAQI